MTLYLDASALLKRYLDEPDSAACEEILLSDERWVSARHCAVEVRRSLARSLDGPPLADARAAFAEDWAFVDVVELDEATCDRAAEIAELLGVRTLDALHLGAAQRAGGSANPFVTYDLRLAQAARAMGWIVLGA